MIPMQQRRRMDETSDGLLLLNPDSHSFNKHPHHQSIGQDNSRNDDNINDEDEEDEDELDLEWAHEESSSANNVPDKHCRLCKSSAGKFSYPSLALYTITHSYSLQLRQD
jgi:hypothetical protein